MPGKNDRSEFVSTILATGARQRWRWQSGWGICLSLSTASHPSASNLVTKTTLHVPYVSPAGSVCLPSWSYCVSCHSPNTESTKALVHPAPQPHAHLLIGEPKRFAMQQLAGSADQVGELFICRNDKDLAVPMMSLTVEQQHKRCLELCYQGCVSMQKEEQIPQP